MYKINTGTLCGWFNPDNLIGYLELQSDCLKYQQYYNTHKRFPIIQFTCSKGSPPGLGPVGASVLSAVSSAMPNKHLVHSFRPADTRITNTCST